VVLQQTMVEAMNPMQGLGMRHGAEREGSEPSYAAWAGSNHVRFCLHIFDLVTLAKFEAFRV